MRSPLAAKWIGGSMALALSLAVCAATEASQVEPGVAAPNFTLVSLSGKTVTLSDFKGTRSAVLVFYFGSD